MRLIIGLDQYYNFHEFQRALSSILGASTHFLYVVQTAGLKYFEDMEVKISREEGKAIAQFVREAALQLFGWDMDGEDSPHMRPMGSFLRGKHGTGVRPKHTS